MKLCTQLQDYRCNTVVRSTDCGARLSWVQIQVLSPIGVILGKLNVVQVKLLI